jgi:hypothetical protein
VSALAQRVGGSVCGRWDRSKAAACVVGALLSFLLCHLPSKASPPDHLLVFAWVEVVEAEDRFPLLADGSRGRPERDALMEAARRRGVVVRLARTADAYQLGHVATETDGALAPLRRMAGDGVLLTGTLTRRGDGLWDCTWALEDARGAKDGPRARSLQLERTSLDTVVQAGVELAAGKP